MIDGNLEIVIEKNQKENQEIYEEAVSYLEKPPQIFTVLFTTVNINNQQELQYGMCLLSNFLTLVFIWKIFSIFS